MQFYLYENFTTLPRFFVNILTNRHIVKMLQVVRVGAELVQVQAWNHSHHYDFRHLVSPASKSKYERNNVKAM